ncbi:hypothetical protein BOTNAR_0419g00030 [Botryotinia narcissicola]|uniref:Uncharacterized protein n=1 Tax=Botryotinia narcissicola TaxID=278944 RepID=A0A4Z1HL14_9HELO|nr:hypothetical protein BOTNAR_0419g00030 [Botryotinia narcissicola]
MKKPSLSCPSTAIAGDRADKTPELAYSLSTLVETYLAGLQDLVLRIQCPIVDLDSICNHNAWFPYCDPRHFLSKFLPPLKSSIFILMLIIANQGLSRLTAV